MIAQKERNVIKFQKFLCKSSSYFPLANISGLHSTGFNIFPNRPVASNHIHIQILIGTVFGSLHFSLGVLSTDFSFNGTALCRSGYVLKITALKNLNFFKMFSRILVVFWHAYSYRAVFIIKLFEVVLYTGSSYSSNYNILSNFQWCSFFFIK